MKYKLVHGNSLEYFQDKKYTYGDNITVISDFPYGIDFQYGVYNDSRINLINIIDTTLPQLERIAKRVVIIPGQTQVMLYPQPDWIGAITWNTTGQYGALGFTQFMPYLFYGEDIKGIGSVNGVIKSDCIRISGGDGVGFRRTENINHPCPKPLNIMDYLVRRFSNKGDLIIDPFMGSGSTGIAAIKNGRKFLGIEMDEDYYKEAQQRIANAAGDYTTTEAERAAGKVSLFGWER